MNDSTPLGQVVALDDACDRIERLTDCLALSLDETLTMTAFTRAVTAELITIRLAAEHLRRAATVSGWDRHLSGDGLVAEIDHHQHTGDDQ